MKGKTEKKVKVKVKVKMKVKIKMKVQVQVTIKVKVTVIVKVKVSLKNAYMAYNKTSLEYKTTHSVCVKCMSAWPQFEY